MLAVSSIIRILCTTGRVPCYTTGNLIGGFKSQNYIKNSLKSSELFFLENVW